MPRVTRVFGLAALLALLLVGLVVQTVNAATITTLAVRCQYTLVRGSIEVSAPFVRVQVVRADDLSNVLETRVVQVRGDGSYAALLQYTAQPHGTGLIVSVGEWDGANYVQPATLVGRNCGQSSTATPIPSPTITPSFTPIPPTQVPPTVVITPGTLPPTLVPTTGSTVVPSPTHTSTPRPTFTPSPTASN